MSGELNLPPHLMHALEALSVLPSNTLVIRKPDGKWVTKREPGQALKQLGPFGVTKAKMFLSFTSKSEPGMYRVDYRTKLSKLEEWVLPTGCHGPITEIPWCDEDKWKIDILIHVPPRTHLPTLFCWCYPPAGMEALDPERKLLLERYIKASDPEFTFLAFGGFVYFSETLEGNLQILRCSALTQGGTGLTFEPPETWRSEFTPYLFRQGRFQGVTIQSLKDLGLNHYCYINPNEELLSEAGDTWKPCANGGFIYLYNPNTEPHALDCFFPQSPTFLDPPSGSLLSSSPPSPLSTSAGSIPFSMVVRNAAKLPQPPPAAALSGTRSREGSITSESAPHTSVPETFKPQSSHPSPNPSPSTAPLHTCVICWEQPVSILMLPCKRIFPFTISHLNPSLILEDICACSQCVTLVKDKCPLCRREIRETWSVFL